MSYKTKRTKKAKGKKTVFPYNGGAVVITKARDNGFKMLFSDNRLVVDFLRDFIRIDALKDVKPEDVEDVTKRFVSMFVEQKDADTVKIICVNAEEPFYLILLLEHESHINHRQAFKMLQYTVLIYSDYEHEADSKDAGASRRKGFSYPPVLPVVLYDGGGAWTAERQFYNKVVPNAALAKYIPRFEYEVVNLSDYSEETLAKFGDALSIALIIDKLRDLNFRDLKKRLPADYFEKLAALDISEQTRQAISSFVTVLLTKINAQESEIDAVNEYIYETSFDEMFTFLEEADIQAERAKTAHAIEKAKEAERAKEQAEREKEQAEREKEQAKREKEQAERRGILLALKHGISYEDISLDYSLSIDEIKKIESSAD